MVWTTSAHDTAPGRLTPGPRPGVTHQATRQLPAHVAPGALLQPLPEVLQQLPPPAAPLLHVAPHLRRQVSPPQVLAPPQHEAERPAAVTPGPTRLLVVRLQCPR